MTADLGDWLGYQIKRVESLLRSAMEAALRPHGLTVPQYASLELLERNPGLSNAELARGSFVTRQSSSVVLQGLLRAGLVDRPDEVTHGRARPATLTATGRERLGAARASVREVEQRLHGALGPGRLDAARADLDAMSRALGGDHPAGHA